MNEDELELARASAEGTFAGLTKSFHELVMKLGGPAAEQIGGAFGDQLFVWRLERSVRLQRRVDDLLTGRSGRASVPPKVLVPALQQATLEDDDFLQDKWAALLAHEASEGASHGLGKVFVEILGQLTPSDALFLEMFAELCSKERTSSFYFRKGISLEGVNRGFDDLARSGRAVSFALSRDNLLRVGLIQELPDLNLEVSQRAAEDDAVDESFILQFTITEIGRAFVEATRLPRAWDHPGR